MRDHHPKTPSSPVVPTSPVTPSSSVTLSSILAVCLGGMLSILAPAQKKRGNPDSWQTDPYSKHDPALMAKAGYVSFGPFPWGDDHGTNDIRKMFPGVRLRFVETAHFKIGSSLGAYSVPRGAKLEKKILGAELTRLKRVFPSIKPTARKLDPWLRLHLFALRLEETYADFCQRIAVKDADFPKDITKRISTVGVRGAASQSAPDGTRYMGQGPYLGMRGKFLVLLMTQGGNLDRYAARAKGGMQTTGTPMPIRHYFAKSGSLFFGTSCQCAEGALYNDHALHCQLVFNTIHSLVDGYKDFFFSVPVWCREGLSHWYLFRIDPREHCFTGIKGRSNTKRYDPRWNVKIKKRLKHDDFTPAAKLTRYMAFTDLTFGDHMAIWSRIDFLQSLGAAKFGTFMGILKDKIEVRAGTFPTNDQIFRQQERALRVAYGFDHEGFDAAWRAYVKATYPDK